MSQQNNFDYDKWIKNLKLNDKIEVYYHEEWKTAFVNEIDNDFIKVTSQESGYEEPEIFKKTDKHKIQPLYSHTIQYDVYIPWPHFPC